jgi:hypothetical protein
MGRNRCGDVPNVEEAGPGRLGSAFVSPTLAGIDHINGAAPATGTDQPLAPVGNRSLGAVSFGHFSGIGTYATYGGTK